MKIFQKHLPNLAQLALVAFFLLLVPSQSFGKDATFQWTANPEPFIGYKLYYKTGADSGQPYNGTGLPADDSPILLSKVSTYTVTGLSPEETYQFVLTAYDDNEESGYSAVATIAPDSSLAPVIINMKTIN